MAGRHTFAMSRSSQALVTAEMSEIIDAAEANFDILVLNSTKPVLVDFWRQACAPCRMLAPVLQRFAEQNGNIQVVKIDVETNASLAERYRIASLPSLSLFVGGEVVKSMAGAKTLAVLNAEFGPYAAARAEGA
jgi:thioredoxin 1